MTLTVVISVSGHYLLPGGLALPIGIYSAVKRYSIGDYIAPSLALLVWPSLDLC
jgi:ABC-type dipeptide/oligopeptide/nickel transport system permease component